ncbi:hypothetical protein NSQ43_08745 [Sporosarcina sp. FSL W8-0480]
MFIDDQRRNDLICYPNSAITAANRETRATTGSNERFNKQHQK